MAGDALTFRVAFVVRWLLWVVRFVVIWPLATMALMALFVLWKDNTTPGKLRKRKANAVCNTCSLQTKLELLLN
ncbi:traP family protein [Escherichia coli 2729250]|nr:conjugal transfer protein TraP [Escherichia coli]EHX95759.1 conjugal transfer TraP domain protein [Escherichia coli DEC14D]EMV81615.1 traP family protein [Escherichia coli 2860050]EMW68092.1 traP family protein [Escherichia coli 2747800]EMZ82502.1 traP family protein [Escherichia coli p0305293.1]ENA44613.1 traP family protein [Escherichia coli 2729250]END28928.1 traP family protein [Escherichia coli p0305293.13]ENG72301.1 traP family protein [Escherichia coli p0305293.9]ENG74031.1 traP f